MNSTAIIVFFSQICFLIIMFEYQVLNVISRFSVYVLFFLFYSKFDEYRMGSIKRGVFAVLWKLNAIYIPLAHSL